MPLLAGSGLETALDLADSSFESADSCTYETVGMLLAADHVLSSAADAQLSADSLY